MTLGITERLSDGTIIDNNAAITSGQLETAQ